MNKLLQRQVNKYLGTPESLPDNILKFLSVVAESYEHYEKDRLMLERSLELSAREMMELNAEYRKEIEKDNNKVYESLKESLNNLQEGDHASSGIPDTNKVAHLADMMRNETRKRKQAEKQNQRHLSHLEASQRIAKVGSWELIVALDAPVTDNNNIKAFYTSEESCNILGFEPGTNIDSQLFFSRVHPEDLEYVNMTFSRALNEKGIYDVEHRIVTPQGIVKAVHGRAEVHLDDQENCLLVKGTLQDISDSKERDLQLTNAHHELKTLFNNMQDVYFSVDMIQYKLLQISPACERVYGCTTREFMDNPNLWLEVVLEEDKPIIYRNTPAMERGETIDHEYRILHKNGEIRWLESKIQPTLNEERKIIRIDGLTTDVTRKKVAEQALKDSEAKFRFLIENSVDAIMVLNEESVVSYASDSLYRIMGYSPQEVIGVKAFNYIYPEDATLLQQHTQKVLDNPGKSFTIIYRRVKKDGSYIWCEGSAINLLHEEAIQGIVVNFRDITDRKTYEDALKISYEDLKKTNSELDRFVYSVSHDLRAPLSSMMGIVEMSEEESTDELMLTHLGMLKRSINRLDGFIGDILDYSRNSRSELKAEPINFEELINDVKQHLKFMDGNNRLVEIRVEVEEGLKFSSDKSRISIILNNLISNAIRYRDPAREKPYVRIGVMRKGDSVELVVEDNGTGISQDKHNKIFEMFYRVANKSIGSGLGLYIVKETVEKLHGKLALESELGVGSTFHISLPLMVNS